MKCLARNKKAFYYCTFKNKQELVDSNGYSTGEFKITYNTAIEMKAYITPATGNISLELFGSNENYDKIIIVDNANCPIDSNTVLFIETIPSYDSENTPQYNYIVKRVARSLNISAYAVKKVK